MKKRVYQILLATLCMLCLGAQESTYAALPSMVDRYPFLIITDDAQLHDLDLSDEAFYERSRSILFRVNSSEIGTGDDFVRLYEDSIVPLINEHHLQLRKIYIRGAASPEGPYANNQRLGKQRTQALVDVIQRRLNFQESKIEVSTKSVTEDYGYLCLLMQKDGSPDYEAVRTIYEKTQGNEAQCKRQLQQAQGGQLWKRLLTQYFPRLRTARFVLWIHDPHYVPEPETPVVEVPMVEAPVVAPPVIEAQAPEVEAPAVVEIPPVEEPLVWDTLPRRHLIALRTNLLHDLLYVPQFGLAWGGNLQLEYYPKKGHYTYNIGFTFSNHRHWSDYKFFQMRDLQLELRRYFKGEGAFIGPYLSLYAEGTKYGIGFSKTKGWEGEGGGGGLSVGYTCKLTRKGNLRLEFSASLGVFITRYDPYIYNHPFVGYDDGLYYYDFYGNLADFKERNHQLTWVGPTNAGIHLTYDIIYRKRQIVDSRQKGGNR